MFYGIKALLYAAPCVSKPFTQDMLHPDPFQQTQNWMNYARKAGLPEPNAMSVATVGPDARPSQRMVLLKHISEEHGLLFYTNYGSRKAGELDNSPYCSLLFHYHILQRQIRVEGKVERAKREESEAYFASRPRSSQLGAWASQQSQPLADRETFEARYQEVEKRFEGQDVPCPEFWGGYRITPERFEFWQGRAYRLHDRFTVIRNEQGSWETERLYP